MKKLQKTSRGGTPSRGRAGVDPLDNARARARGHYSGAGAGRPTCLRGTCPIVH